MEDLSTVPWKTLSTRPIYQNKWISLREDEVELPNGQTTIYGVVTTNACVGVLPFADPRTVVLIQQYRYVSRRVTWEIPCGAAHAGETMLAAAQRELAEETGYQAGRLRHICTYNSSKSILDETAHIFLGEELSALPLQSDDTEFITVRPFPFTEVLQMVHSGAIVDGMTIIAVLHAARLQDAKRPPTRGPRGLMRH
ncbi:MAG: NUDIX hydrolase [Candidatus Tectomicrobia bacterium]|uniref:GDP-mannose pyrophosphatase n=1 Tax=Tectimicrobiota bacterium TaxID=2528274 RepID=A0A937W3R2_UNCTE|nr:NUDIX hydrolase [Candidatus Tectomicrobia bacterium]